MLALPRSVRLATWGTVWLTGDADLDDVVTRVRGDDEPHEVDGVPGRATPETLVAALTALRAAGSRALRVTLPGPGDPHGLGGPSVLTRAATDAGEAVVAVGAPYSLVPVVTPFGPPGDQGHLVRWNWYDANPLRPEVGLAEADRELVEALLAASATLADLDVAAWRPEAVALLDDVRAERGAAPLPRTYPAQAQALAARSARLLAVVGFARRDDGGALTAASARARIEALRPLEVAARHALAAACNCLPGRR